MHVVEQETVFGELVDVRRADRRTVAAKLAEAGVVNDDEEDVRRAFLGAKRRRPSRLGFADGAAHAPWEGRARLVFLERHVSLPLAVQVNTPFASFVRGAPAGLGRALSWVPRKTLPRRTASPFHERRVQREIGVEAATS